MLTVRDFRYNLFLLRALSALKVISVDIDGEQGTLKVPLSPWKRRISSGLFGLSILHGCYIHWRLLQALLFSHVAVRHHLVFHVDASLISFMVQGWYVVCFIQNPGTFVASFNSSFGLIGGQGLSAARKAYTRQEWLALTLPALIVQTIVFIIGLYTYDRTMAFLLYSWLPEDYKTAIWFGLLFCEEIRYLFWLGCNFSLVLDAQLLFFENITSSLKSLEGSVTLLGRRCTEGMIGRACVQLREIQLKVRLFNEIIRYIVLSFKLYCLTLATLSGYFMIAYFSADPVFGCMYYIIFGLLCSTYSIMYEKAFTVPEMVSLTKSAVLLNAGNGTRQQGFQRLTKMRLRSVPEVGIQVGRFHALERVATLLFMDYVLNNVVGLLVMHSGN